MNNRLKIYTNIVKAGLLNERRNLNTYHAFTNATELIKILDRNFSFIHINKNGGSTVEKVFGLKDQSHIPYYTLEDNYGVERAKKLRIATMVRNPYDRVVSQYHYRLQNNQNNLRSSNTSFKEFCLGAYQTRSEDIINYPLMFKTQHQWLEDYKGEINHIGYIGKFENFDLSLSEISKFFGIEVHLKSLPKKRSSKRHKNWEQYYDKETKEVIFNYFKKDFEVFGYNE